MVDEVRQASDATARELDEDRPYHFDRSLWPEEVVSPLAAFKGARPPAPDWFNEALADAPERSFVRSQGTRIELLTWGERGKPGLLLIHGNGAHADWWSFIAPFLAQDYRVAAMSLAGMGGSDWRERYCGADVMRDAAACAEAAGLHDDGRPPVYIGHSFGAAQVLYGALFHPEQMRAAVLLDCGFGPPPEMRAQRIAEYRRRQIEPVPPKSWRVQASLPEALARFRLSPPQPVENLYIADFIARGALRQAPMPDGSGDGWQWRFDPDAWDKFDLTDTFPPCLPVESIPTPVVHIYGAKSDIVNRREAGDNHRPVGLTEIVIPESYHHLMIDQPLALVTAIRTTLALWPS